MEESWILFKLRRAAAEPRVLCVCALLLCVLLQTSQRSPSAKYMLLLCGRAVGHFFTISIFIGLGFLNLGVGVFYLSLAVWPCTTASLVLYYSFNALLLFF